MTRLFAFLAFFSLSSAAMAADEPAHTVVLRAGAFEIRDYDAMLMAEVDVGTTQMSRAGNAGFRPLADFIFGNNTAPQGGSGEIAMTTPVVQQRSEEIAMTSPVVQGREGETWRVGFVMPAEYTMETLPRPNNPNVQIREQAPRRMAIVRFNGGARESRFMAYEAELRAWLSEAGYEVRGEAVYARYDPPWIPTPFRRNEVMLEIAR